jgi:hypothetical protein
VLYQLSYCGGIARSKPSLKASPFLVTTADFINIAKIAGMSGFRCRPDKNGSRETFLSD